MHNFDETILMRNRLSLFCICLILFSALLVAFHHHDDGREHDDCPICSAGANLQHATVDLAIPIIVIHRDYARIEFIIPATPGFVKTFSTPVNSRASPA
jgi:hypothetical protein